MPDHVSLLGDSIFDNRAYTRGAPDVISHLRSMLPSGWKASLEAVDGAVTHHLLSQLTTAATALGRHTTLCTVYNGNLDPAEAPRARIALTIFNDVILRTAFERGLPVIDLRFVCREPSDYANPIEPSGSGGRKIATAIVHSLQLHQRIKSSSCVFAS